MDTAKNKNQLIERFRAAAHHRFRKKLRVLTRTELNGTLDALGINIEGEKLGTGSYGKAYAGSWTMQGEEGGRLRQVVIKIQRDVGQALIDPDRVIREFQISFKLNHPNLAKTFFAFGPVIDDLSELPITRAMLEGGEDTLGVIMVLERYHGGDLLTYCDDVCKYKVQVKNNLRNRRSRQPSYMVKNVMEQVLHAVKYLFDRWISHRDLAERNVMFDKHGTVKVIDFGMSWDLTRHKLSANQVAMQSASQGGEPPAGGAIPGMRVSGDDTTLPQSEKVSQISAGTEKMVREWRISDQDRYPTRARTPDSVFDEKKTLPVGKEVMDRCFGQDLEMMSDMILFMVCDEKNQKLTPMLGHTMLARFYQSLEGSAEQVAKDGQNPMEHILGHPFLIYDPIHMFFTLK